MFCNNIRLIKYLGHYCRYYWQDLRTIFFSRIRREKRVVCDTFIHADKYNLFRGNKSCRFAAAARKILLRASYVPYYCYTRPARGEARGAP